MVGKTPLYDVCEHIGKESETENVLARLCPTLCDPIDCSPPGSSVHGILQARRLEWLAMPFSRGSSRPRDWTQVFPTNDKAPCNLDWGVTPPLSSLSDSIKILCLLTQFMSEQRLPLISGLPDVVGHLELSKCSLNVHNIMKYTINIIVQNSFHLYKTPLTWMEHERIKGK